MKTKHLLFAVPVLAMGMVSCSNEDDVKPQNIITGESVKTSLAINVPVDKYTTRQSAETTQNNANFRGMSGMMLFPMAGAPQMQADNSLPPVGQTLGDPESFSTEKSHHVYRNVQLPIGATHFLLYGVAPGENSTVNDKFTNGILTSTLPIGTGADDTNDIKFELNNIVTEDNLTTPQETFVKYLNDIAKTPDWDSSKEPNLEAAYKAFTLNIGTDHNRAGSATMIKQHVQDLYDKMTLASAVNAEASTIASAVQDNIDKDPFQVVEGVVSFLSTDEKITKFPVAQNLPAGAALLTCTNGEFNYLNEAPTGGAVVLDILDLTYPADLRYYSNSPVRAKSETVEDWSLKVGTTSEDWTGFDWTKDGWKDIIDITTRSVALKHNMNYGVACLETYVKCGKNVLEDNAVIVAGAIANQKISVPSGGFPITGILVGGQPEIVDWNFIDNDAGPGSFSKTVYDNAVPNTMVAKYNNGLLVPNYTLLLDNYVNGDQEDQDLVNLCIELTNNSGQGFYGVDGYIPVGEKFYLIGQLNPNAITGITGPGNVPADDRIYPQKDIKRVFMQDYKTTANITINSLKKAYVTIPDMRSIKLELGVSVDLKWETGYNFNVEIE